MSILLTACKKREKSAKKKKKKQSVPASRPCCDESPRPPISTPRTTVWHWYMGEKATTVIFTKDNNEVWCNGAVLNTEDGFCEDDGDGAEMEFCIYMEDTDSCHRAVIRRMQDADSSSLIHNLLIDGYLIFAYEGQARLQMLPSVYEPVPDDCDWVALNGPPPPPSYDEAMASGGYVEYDYEQKKMQ